MFSELKAFLLRGNVLDLAVGVTIAAAFGKIVDALIENLVSPLIALFTGGATLVDSFVYGGFKVGAFLQAIINFVLVGTVLFFLVKAAQKTGAGNGVDAAK